MVTRRSFLVAAAVASGIPAGAATSDKVKVIVVRENAVTAYREAVEGLREALGDSVAMLETAPAELSKAMMNGSVKAAVAMGIEAREALLQADARIPVVSTMLLLSDTADETGALARPAGAVYLDVSIPQIAAELAKLLPGKTRLGIITGAARRGAPNQRAIKQLVQQGFSVELAPCANAGELLKAFGSLKGKADLVLALPETGLFDSRTIPPLVQASLTQELPVVGFSPAFLNAGAIAAVHPDFREVGRQTGEQVGRVLGGASEAGEETPRKLVASANPRIKRVLGWK